MTPNIYSNIIYGCFNQAGKVKEHWIGQSAAKFPYYGFMEKGSTTISKESRVKLPEKVGFDSIIVYFSCMENYNIYTLSCAKTGDIKYIGATTMSLNQRLSQHKWNAKNKKTKLSLWLKQVNCDVNIEFIEKANKENWKEIEQYWISQFKTWGFNILNVDKGGRGIVKGVRKMTIEFKKKKVNMYSWDGKYIKTFNSIKEAISAVDLKSSSSLTNILQNPGKFSKNLVAGYRWSYFGEKPFPWKAIKASRGGSLVLYKDITIASEKLGFCRTKAKKYLEGKRGPIKGLQIKYDIV